MWLKTRYNNVDRYVLSHRLHGNAFVQLRLSMNTYLDCVNKATSRNIVIQQDDIYFKDLHIILLTLVQVIYISQCICLISVLPFM